MIGNKFLQWYSPIAFNYGLKRLNKTGINLVSKLRINRMLDVGCGDCKLTMEFAHHIHPIKICGVDYMEESQKIARRLGVNWTKHDLNNRWGYKSNQFDLILSSQNIEHVHNSRLYLNECYRCLKPGGTLLILTENLSSWVNIGSLIMGWQPFSTTCMNGYSLGNPLIWHLEADIDKSILDKYEKTGVSGTVGHVRVFAYRGLKEILKISGFEKIILKTTGYFPFFGALSDFLCTIDPKHGHFLLAMASKPKGWKKK